MITALNLLELEPDQSIKITVYQSVFVNKDYDIYYEMRTLRPYSVYIVD